MLIPFDTGFCFKVFTKLIPFLRITFIVLAGSVFFGLFLGIFLAKFRLGKNKVLNRLAGIYITAVRCTPGIVMLFIIYYGIPRIFDSFGININDIPKEFFVIFALGLLFSTSAAEILRSAYLTVSQGQYEAAVTIGLTDFQAYRRIIFPQLFVVALPNFGNSFIGILKEGSLAYSIGLIDIMGKGNLIIASRHGGNTLETYVSLAFLYWFIVILFENLFLFLEKKFTLKNKEPEND